MADNGATGSGRTIEEIVSTTTRRDDHGFPFAVTERVS
ncbi:hypothetical protein B4064_0531 [Caldibacillus thermoamylovorans]|uniref:Uncharacterized protein n=1 Tax=Caldibacillus thermoamylovorans TaxID=35841 RepID=A0A0D0G8D5_9BACI|nr:hypothetical protein B4064_0531 [Caldibacillus thermoamylovorans]KIO65569.1 hypothetical protein B4065_0494 [Caldibacillus thermoamylovorans]KIO70458.1 hypothetical protein B4166_0622 [Caldibacillus thermoamylovorans]KIO72310.1 hypothetical protein B4167_0638 [Caldibacillus thermoamylovorans]